MSYAILDNPRFVEVRGPAEELRRFLESSPGNESDQFAGAYARSQPRGFLINGRHQLIQRRVGEIGKVHGYLRTLSRCQKQSDGFHSAKAPRGFADAAG